MTFLNKAVCLVPFEIRTGIQDMGAILFFSHLKTTQFTPFEMVQVCSLDGATTLEVTT
jgi:hypothetical protein